MGYLHPENNLNDAENEKWVSKQILLRYNLFTATTTASQPKYHFPNDLPTYTSDIFYRVFIKWRCKDLA